MARLFGFGLGRGRVPKGQPGDYSPYGGNDDWHYLGTIGYRIDASDLAKLQQALRAAGHEMPTIMMRAFNHGLDKFFTKTKYMLKEVTGLRKLCRVTHGPSCAGKPKSMVKQPARRGSLGSMTTIGIRVQDRHSRITAAYYGAKWGGRQTPGATHNAWGTPQIARGAFMARYKKNVLPIFVRTTQKSKPIRPLWGPNMAREIDRHPGRVRRIQREVWRENITPEAKRLLEVHLRKQKGKHGL